MGKDASGSPTATLTDTYLGRAGDLGRGLGIAPPQLKVVDAPKALDGPAKSQREGQLLSAALPDKGSIVLLDERGKDWSSTEWANFVDHARQSGEGGLSFVIGGADGFADDFEMSLRARGPRKVCFGRATLPHKLVRVLVAEQIYRALSQLAGHPYHRA